MEDEYGYGDDVQLAESDAFSNVGAGLQGRSKLQLVEYWQQAIDNIERIGETAPGAEPGAGPAQAQQDCFKTTALPLARIKKVMKTDSEVKMISAEAPILFAKGCDIFITELTMRAWIHAEESKRRTLQRSDIATALQKSDMFDFLIDIVPREEAQPRRYHEEEPHAQEPAQEPAQAQAQAQQQAHAQGSVQSPAHAAHAAHAGQGHPQGHPQGHAPADAPGASLHNAHTAHNAHANAHANVHTPVGPSGQGLAGAQTHSPAAASPHLLQHPHAQPGTPLTHSQATPNHSSEYPLHLDNVKLERQYEDFEYQNFEQVDV